MACLSPAVSRVIFCDRSARVAYEWLEMVDQTYRDRAAPSPKISLSISFRRDFSSRWPFRSIPRSFISVSFQKQYAPTRLRRSEQGCRMCWNEAWHCGLLVVNDNSLHMTLLKVQDVGAGSLLKRLNHCQIGCM